MKRVKKIISLLPVVIVLITASCSSGSLKRVGYNTLQNMQRQQCERELSAGCQKKKSYDD